MSSDMYTIVDTEENAVAEEIAADGKPAGVEKEEYAPYPFDTEKISITTKPIPLSTIIRRLKRELIIAAEMQRGDNLWDTGMKSRLIESILLRLPLPLFYASEDKNGKLYIVDGLQRISAIRTFVDENGFILEGLEFLKNLDGKRHDELPEGLQIRIEETSLQFVIIGADSPQEVQRNIFRRLNIGGLPLSDQEIRHALYYGPSAELLQNLVELEQFKTATDNTISDTRMAGRELILRFVAFYMMGTKEYRIDNEMDKFLCDAMQIINDSRPRNRNVNCMDIEKIKNDFILAMVRAEELFDDGAFRMYFRCKARPKAKRSKINKSLFEVWSVLLARMCDEDFHKLLHKRDQLHITMVAHYDNSFKRLCGSDALVAACVKARHVRIEKIVKIVLEDENDYRCNHEKF